MRPHQTLPPPTRILDHIKATFTYDPATGEIRRVKREKSVGIKTKGRGLYVVISLPNDDGTLTVYNTYAHRIAWYLHYQEWPVHLSHIDGNKQNNAIDNLKITDPDDRQPITNKFSTYTRGISWSTNGTKHWRAHIMIGGRKVSLGRFHTEEDAAQAYNEIATVLGKPTTQLIQTHSASFPTSNPNKKDDSQDP